MSLLTKAKELFTRRGGADAAKEDAQEVKDVARGDASTGDKARESAEAIRDPGAPGEPGAEPGAPAEPSTPTEPRTEPGGPSEPEKPAG